jgi:DNA-binding Lrp family transcriptional regulator
MSAVRKETILTIQNSILRYQFNIFSQMMAQAANRLDIVSPEELLERLEGLHKQVLSAMTLAETKVNYRPTPQMQIDGEMAGIVLRFVALVELNKYARFTCGPDAFPADFLNSFQPLKRELEVLMDDLRAAVERHAAAERREQTKQSESKTNEPIQASEANEPVTTGPPFSFV